MDMKYKVEQNTENTWWYYFEEPNTKGETMVIELYRASNPGGSNALPVLWKKNGMIDRVLETYWSIDTYVTDTEGNCYGIYNPQTKLSEDSKRQVINFDWMFEATEENKEKLFNEVLKIFYSQTGETATQEKHRKVREFAKERNLEVYETIPEGWINLNYATAPKGAEYIGNMKVSMQNIRNKNRKEALLLV